MVRIAGCQIRVSEDTDKNLKKILMYLEQAGKKKVDIVCFPEKSLQWHNIPYPDLSDHLKEIGEACKRYSMYCLVGGIVYSGKKKINNLYLIDRRGNLKATHSKVNLFYMEKEIGYKAGKEMTLVKTDIGTIGLSICWDNADPCLIRKLKKADMIFAAMHLNDWKEMGYSLPDWPQTRAFENMCYYVWVDQYRTHKSSSRSYVVHPQKVLKCMFKEGLFYKDVDIDEVRKLKKKFL